MTKIIFKINDKAHEISVEGSPAFGSGNAEVLSSAATDVTYHQDWYPKGFEVFDLMLPKEFENLKKGITQSIQNIIEKELEISLPNFDLTKYHQVVKTDAEHLKIVSKTRDLFSGDFAFSVQSVIPNLEKFLGFELTDINPKDGVKMHIIVRINRPYSNDYNPPHKDIYEGVDGENYIPLFINFWIPICGVTQNSALPISPASHLIPENQILRTFDGAVVAGNKYRVRMVKEWGNNNQLERAKIVDGQVLVFSSHLIHGLAINEEKDLTRVALEFRLFKK
jgi:hypothetical protein